MPVQLCSGGLLLGLLLFDPLEETSVEWYSNYTSI